MYHKASQNSYATSFDYYNDSSTSLSAVFDGQSQITALDTAHINMLTALDAITNDSPTSATYNTPGIVLPDAAALKGLKYRPGYGVYSIEYTLNGTALATQSFTSFNTGTLVFYDVVQSR